MRFRVDFVVRRNVGVEMESRIRLRLGLGLGLRSCFDFECKLGLALD